MSEIKASRPSGKQPFYKSADSIKIMATGTPITLNVNSGYTKHLIQLYLYQPFYLYHI